MEKKIKTTPESVSKIEKYEAPRIEIIEVTVEKGFAQSGVEPESEPTGGRSW